MTVSELRDKFYVYDVEWDKRLKAIREEELNEDYLSVRERKGATIMLTYLYLEVISNLNFILQDFEVKWEELLFYQLNKEEQLISIRSRIDELKLYFKEKPHSFILPSVYLEMVVHDLFSRDLFNSLPMSTQNKLLDKVEVDMNGMVLYDIVVEEMKDFNELNFNVIEFMFLKVLYEEIKSNKYACEDLNQIEISSIEKNEYPEIFTTIEAYNLFNYTVEEVKKKEKIGRAMATKLLEYFKDEEKILKNVKNGHYLDFLKHKHQLSVKKRDYRIISYDNEIKFFKNIENNFKIEYDK